jgi:hypothetical protein
MDETLVLSSNEDDADSSSSFLSSSALSSTTLVSFCEARSMADWISGRLPGPPDEQLLLSARRILSIICSASSGSSRLTEVSLATSFAVDASPVAVDTPVDEGARSIECVAEEGTGDIPRRGL